MVSSSGHVWNSIRGSTQLSTFRWMKIFEAQKVEKSKNPFFALSSPTLSAFYFSTAAPARPLGICIFLIWHFKEKSCALIEIARRRRQNTACKPFRHAVTTAGSFWGSQYTNCSAWGFCLLCFLRARYFVQPEIATRTVFYDFPIRIFRVYIILLQFYTSFSRIKTRFTVENS